MKKFEELLVNKGLYNSVKISVEDINEMNDLLSGADCGAYKIDCFCVECNKISTFHSVRSQTYNKKSELIKVPFLTDEVKAIIESKNKDLFKSYLNNRYSLFFQCAREPKHFLLFDLLITNNEMIKIGQYPSFYDIYVGNTRKYNSILKDKFNEFNKALMLYAHGFSIGAFVYLRRIIESLVLDKFNEFSSELGIDKEKFINSKFVDKITILKNYLPKILVDNKNIYGIVSKGIHELDEDTCNNMFPLIKTGIELILDDILVEKERKEKEKEFSKFVSNKFGELKKI